MARRDNKDAVADSPADTATATDATATDAAPAATEKPAEVPINLDAFNQTVSSAVEASDDSTGVVPEASLSEVTKAYRDLDGAKAKNAAKSVVNEGLKDAVNSLDVVRGRAYMMIGEVLTAGAGGTKTERAPADPTEALVQRIVTLDLARNLLPVPEGVDVDAATQKAEARYNELLDGAQSYLAWSLNEAEDKGDEPDVNSTVKAAVKLATGKTAKASGRTSGGGSSFDGPRRDIGEHIRQAFEGVASGEFKTIAEIRNFESTEYGKDSPPSAGAISARLFPQSGKCTLDFVTPDTNEKGNRGAKKN